MGGRHIGASQAHCIALHPTPRGCGGGLARLAQCQLLVDATTPAADATSLKHVRRPKHNMATPRVETKDTGCQGRNARAGKMLLVPHLTASRLCPSPLHSPRCTRRTPPTSHDCPSLSLSCLAQIVERPIDDVRDSVARRSLQGWSATARGTYICSAGTARSGRPILERYNLASGNVAAGQSCTAASPLK